jgi:hypothetical protein
MWVAPDETRKEIKNIECFQNPIGVQHLMSIEQNPERSDATADAMKN